MSFSHGKTNQSNYKASAHLHAKINIDSTLFLAYRDIVFLLEKHLFHHNKKETYRVLDFGCGAGLSTHIISQRIEEAGFKVDITGVDISEENLKQAKTRLPDAQFIQITPNQSLSKLGEFDIIICNFVLVENKYKEMLNILRSLQPLLANDGVLIVTNPSSKVYKQANKWYSLNNDFPENKPLGFRNGKIKFQDDQPIKLQFYTSTTSFTFSDFFHSGAAYKEAYKEAGLTLAETYKPVGYHSDGIPWKSEKDFSPYKIHILHNLSPRREMEYKRSKL